jgi:hypothetical protein
VSTKFYGDLGGSWSTFNRFPRDDYWIVQVAGHLSDAIAEAQAAIADPETAGIEPTAEFRFKFGNVPVVVTARSVPGILRRCVMLAYKDRTTDVVGPCEPPARTPIADETADTLGYFMPGALSVPRMTPELRDAIRRAGQELGASRIRYTTPAGDDQDDQIRFGRSPFPPSGDNPNEGRCGDGR